MNVKVAYRGRSELTTGVGATLRFAPNLSRDPVAFDGALRSPLRFREAISALHDVVISDLRHQPRDKTAYEEWKREQEKQAAVIRQTEFKRVKEQVLAAQGEVSPEFETQFQKCRKRYWDARREYTAYLRKNDPQLWRMFMPLDPVVTVSDDVVFFECFSADESSYGCLTVDREAGFEHAADMQFGTTNVDYSWDLYDHFQSLRSYRETRLRVDPTGFETVTDDAGAYREEKIDLPDGWLRGFMQIQAAMGMPMRRVPLSRESVYSILAWLKRNKAKKSPRALRFELLPDKPPTMILEPWEKRITSADTRYVGPSGEPIRIWGVRRLLMLARLLPLVERFDVYLLGTGMPSFWVARMGDMRMTVGLSGWTTNDWTRGSALDLLAPPVEPPRDLIEHARGVIRRDRALTLDDLCRSTGAAHGPALAAARHLAHAGQVIHDLGAGVFRWRQVLPMAVGEQEMGPENEELLRSRVLVAHRRVRIESTADGPGGTTLHSANVDGTPVELLLDLDGAIKRGKCLCGHHRRAGLRMGPCRHLLALRQVATLKQEMGDNTSESWYDHLRDWAGG